MCVNTCVCLLDNNDRYSIIIFLTKHCDIYFTYIISFNFYNNPVGRYYYSYFRDKLDLETDWLTQSHHPS